MDYLMLLDLNEQETFDRKIDILNNKELDSVLNEVLE